MRANENLAFFDRALIDPDVLRVRDLQGRRPGDQVQSDRDGVQEHAIHFPAGWRSSSVHPSSFGRLATLLRWCRSLAVLNAKSAWLPLACSFGAFVGVQERSDQRQCVRHDHRLLQQDFHAAAQSLHPPVLHEPGKASGDHRNVEICFLKFLWLYYRSQFSIWCVIASWAFLVLAFHRQFSSRQVSSVGLSPLAKPVLTASPLPRSPVFQ